ncbi:MAG: peptide MFS transporter [Sphingomicrobium sp.]
MFVAKSQALAPRSTYSYHESSLQEKPLRQTHPGHDAGELKVSRGFLGHPVGLGYLCLSYSFERFAFYGMQALLALYMTQSLLKPGHIEHVWGLTTLRHFIGGDTMTIQALASTIYGFYLAACYATPLLGGLIADRFLGRTPTIILGAIVLIVGHFLMAFDATFLIALATLFVGVGLMKGNVATQVGALYAPDDLRRSDAFQIFVTSFQLSGVLAPLICGTLGEEVGWHYGYGAAGIAMVIALIIYLSTRRHYPPDPPIARRASGGRAPITPTDRRTLAVLIGIVPVFGIMSVINDQIYNAYIIWGARSFDRMFFGHQMPASWLGSIDTTMAIVTAIMVLAFWRWFARQRDDADEITKVAISGFFIIAASLTLVAASAVAETTGGRISLWWAIAFEFFDGVGFAMLYAIGLAMFVRAAPRSLAGLIVGVFYIHLVISNLLVGWLGGLLGTMADSQFWLIHAGFGSVGTAALFGFRALFKAELAPIRVS